MLRLDRAARLLTPVTQQSLPEAGLQERHDLQQMIKNAPDKFFNEMGEPLLLLGEEVYPSHHVGDRIDLLALDEDGSLVVIELKRASHKLQLLQSLAYAAMIASWSTDRLATLRANLTEKENDEAQSDIENHLLDDAEFGSINRAQRVILIAEDFEYEVLATAEWLWERYKVDIRCYRLALSIDAPAEYLSCTCIFPPSEIAEEARRRGRISDGTGTMGRTWEETLKKTSNPAVRKFFEDEIATGATGNSSTGRLRYFFGGRRRYALRLKRLFAAAYQSGRFDGDETFWAERLGPEAALRASRNGRRLLFRLHSDADFATFREALSLAPTRAFSTTPSRADDSDEDDADEG